MFKEGNEVGYSVPETESQCLRNPSRNQPTTKQNKTCHSFKVMT